MELSEEEKKAIEIIKGLYVEEYDWYEDSKYCTGHSGEAVTIVEDSLKNILNLVDKQQKEIEKKKGLIDVLQHRIEELLDVLDNEKKLNYIKPIDITVHNYISKDKIIEKIEELKEIADEDNQEIYIKIDILKELLEDDGDHIPRID